MSRSYRKTPICSNSVGGFSRGEKADKRIANKKLRAHIRSLDFLDEDTIQDLDLNDVSDICTFDKDGKQYIESDSEYYDKLMRK